ncbi:Hypothetical protein IALB_0142 [Ignavibacterium album JCM 16511]|uniref:Glucosyltransferase-I n=1 Tax=Ignavibacterium album (strain DSM 19864 / JCM 16511 / NBRC 101810 / Mat9-16) TaxID=945713 RepID=I0AFU7_IGNAJ|nr:hypothetical protein [Ignavibacterium album]AFH47854.1 Hypothetical protein IALB_0142 [Ignavibacterium album JCM 16511]
MKPISLMPLIILLIQILLITTGCKQTTEPKLEPELKLELEDVSCTEAWINLRITNLQLPANVTLYKNSVAQNNILCYGDTLLYVDSLLPNQTYKFKSIVQSSNQQIITSSNELTVTTMDTTSHDFTWQSWEFGQHSSSTLYDVAIIDENNIWAVGEIYMNDSLGRPDPNAYNAVHWDGTKWELKRIYFPTVCGGTSLSSYPAKAIFIFDDGQIWISSSGDKIAILKDGIQINKFCLPSNVSMSINKLWGSSSSDLYAVGNNGNIAHWDGRKWTKIESGTYLNIGTIWGISDNKGGYNKFLAAGDMMIILNNENKVNIVLPGPNMFVNSLWGINNNLIYTAGNGIVLFKNNKWEKITIPELNTVYSIKGNNFNNVFGISSVFSVVHFNGFSWQFINRGDTKIYFRLGVKNNLAVAVGWQGDRAVLTLLRRIS